MALDAKKSKNTEGTLAVGTDGPEHPLFACWGAGELLRGLKV